MLWCYAMLVKYVLHVRMVCMHECMYVILCYACTHVGMLCMIVRNVCYVHMSGLYARILSVYVFQCVYMPLSYVGYVMCLCNVRIYVYLVYIYVSL